MFSLIDRYLFIGWRDECYEVLTSAENLTVMKMDRSGSSQLLLPIHIQYSIYFLATCLFGIRNFGVEINGYIQCPTRGICIWLQQRR